ncbi:hypothetical protein OXX80_004732 [Metschnikowia pulcherrima]
MCGIFFQGSKKRVETPIWLQKGLKECRSLGKSDYYSATELLAEDITQLIAQDLESHTILSEEDKHKIINVGRLRELCEELKIYKNGQHKTQNREKVEAIEAEMAKLADSSTAIDKPKQTNQSEVDLSDPILAVLARGPDYARYSELGFSGNHYQLFSSVLSLRQPFTQQPLYNGEWILQFNGELYNDECMDGNDTVFIMGQLMSELKKCEEKFQAVASVIARLDGEFAFVLTDTQNSKVYFGKDSVGKRSLLYENTPDRVCISSICPRNAANAVECVGNQLYVADMHTYKVTSTQLKPNQYHLQPASQYSEEEDCHDKCLGLLHEKLIQACDKRQRTIHPLHPHSEDARIGILFSGGLDCTVLAAIIGKNFVDRNETCLIDLLTVGFDNPRTGLPASESPDRVLSEQSWFELCQNFQDSSVTFRLVQIDVSYAEWLAHRERVRGLIYPRATEMDLSIAIAFYFATRAANCTILEIHDNIIDLSWSDFQKSKTDYVSERGSYTSQAKVLFSGLGADELFGGYSRHENIFHGLKEDSATEVINQRYEELSQSLIHDIDVIYERNLGRDDRAMSSWGKELRYPYLDQSFIRWVIEEVNPKLKMIFEWKTQKTKKGEKRVMSFERKYLLRKLAERLGLNLASKEAKRAIQFGAKSAKMEVGQSKTRGTDTL